MQRRYGKYFADWRDANGVRHRKAFPTAQEARQFAKKMAEVARKNRLAQRRPLRRPLRSTSTRKGTTPTPRHRSPR